jgi:uncharacterized protein YlxW (UPF0749 family)
VTTPAPDDRRLVSTRLLVELVNNHLDPGYAAAAQQRGPDAPRRWYDRPAVIVGCLLIGFVLAYAYVYTHRSAPATKKVHDSLVQRVRTAQKQGDALAQRVSSLEASLSRAQDSALPKSGTLARKLNLAELQAGLVAVSGPGFVVTLREPAAPTSTPSAGRGGTTPITSGNILTDRDVRSVVNELWRDGAEAISVNDVRLAPTSAIRFAGEAVLVDFQPITAPFRIRAVGNADDLAVRFAQSAIASRYKTLEGVEHIGFTFGNADHLSLPASPPVNLRYARVGRGGHR